MYTIPKFDKIKKVTVSEAVFEQLKQSIVLQDFPVGSKLPSENQLAEMFDVSRTSIRTAIQKLVALGMVETKDGDGTYVIGLGPNNLVSAALNGINLESSEVLEVLELRQALEAKSCYLAAKNVEKKIVLQDDLEGLKQIIDDMHLARERNDIKQYSLKDMKFHCYIADLSKNSLIAMVIKKLTDFILGHLLEMNSKIGIEFGFNYHIAIYDAIKNGEARIAELLIFECINKSIDEVKKWQKFD